MAAKRRSAASSVARVRFACDGYARSLRPCSARFSLPGRSPTRPEEAPIVGIDLIEIERVRRAMLRYPSFTERCFTEVERAYCESRPNPAQHYAARFAGKEAVGKALGFGVARQFAWREVEIAGRPKPAVRLSGRLEERASQLGIERVELSMTHSRELAAAIAVANGA